MLETERLFIRRFEEKDLKNVAAMRADKDVMRYIREPQNRDESANWINLINTRWEKERIGFCGLFEKRTSEFAGWCGLWVLKETEETEIGYAVAKKFWGKGYAAEAARAFLDYGFNELNLEKIVAVADPKNTGSLRVMEKLGMKYAGTGIFYNKKLVRYRITKDEFDRNRTAANA